MFNLINDLLIIINIIYNISVLLFWQSDKEKFAIGLPELQDFFTNCCAQKSNAVNEKVLYSCELQEQHWDKKQRVKKHRSPFCPL